MLGTGIRIGVRNCLGSLGRGGTIASLDTIRGVLRRSWSWSGADEPDRLGAELARRRKAKGLSQRDMAARLGVTQQTVVTLENMFRGRVETLRRYLKLLGIHALLRDVGSSRRLVPPGNDADADRVFTPRDLARRIVERLNPHIARSILDPARGQGAFFDCFPARLHRHWCELDDGQDFMAWTRRVDWIVTNPPFSRFRDFLTHTHEIANNVVFLASLSNFTTRYRIAQVRRAGYDVRLILLVPTPEHWPNSGFQVAAVWLQRSWIGTARIEDLV